MSNARWIEALRSGVYAQTVGVLSHRGKYCCLGVLAEVEDATRDTDDAGFMVVGTDDGAISNDSLLDQEWFEETTDLSKRTMLDLSFINDNGGTFNDIADALDSEDPLAAIALLKHDARRERYGNEEDDEKEEEE